MNKKTLFLSLALLAVCVLLALSVRSASSADKNYKRATVTLAGRPFSALVSDTDALREQGLSGRSGLGKGQAMLFVFDRPDKVGFWMKDMKFSIDILWLDEDLRVISFEKGATPESYPKAFYPSSPAKYVVELPAGTLDSLSTKIGDNALVSGGK